MDLLRLRQATAAEHSTTERSVPVLSSSLSQKEYVAVLLRFYQIVDAWDRWADAHAPAELYTLRQGRRRAASLADDLLVFGVSQPPSGEPAMRRMTDTAIAGDPRAVFLGRMYVMEGSTLGGQYIAAHVEKLLGLTPGEGTAFFRGYGDQTAARWREFRAVLAALPEEVTETVIASACNMFALFAEAMRDGNEAVVRNEDADAGQTSGRVSRITE